MITFLLPSKRHSGSVNLCVPKEIFNKRWRKRNQEVQSWGKLLWGDRESERNICTAVFSFLRTNEGISVYDAITVHVIRLLTLISDISCQLLLPDPLHCVLNQWMEGTGIRIIITTDAHDVLHSCSLIRWVETVLEEWNFTHVEMIVERKAQALVRDL